MGFSVVVFFCLFFNVFGLLYLRSINSSSLFFSRFLSSYFWVSLVVLCRAYCGLTGGFPLLRNFSVAITVNPHVCFILVLILISMFLG